MRMFENNSSTSTAEFITQSVWIIVLFGTLYTRSTLSFPSVEGAGCRPQWLPSSEPNLHWFVHQSTEKPEFPAVVLFMDEPCFTREGIFSSYNSHVWAQANPYAASNSALWSTFGQALYMAF
jgi:hypothetical protein